MYETITNASIKSFAEKLGYDKYIPYDLVRDIMTCHFYEFTYGNFKPYIDIHNAYKSDLISLMDSVYIDTTMSSIRFAINLLKRISSVVNLRDISSGLKFESTKQLNYDIDLKSYDETVKELLEIDDTTFNIKELDDDILSILRSTSGIVVGEGFETSRITRHSRIKNYSDIVRINATTKCLPNFNYKFLKKECTIKTKDVLYVGKANKVLAVDISRSHADDNIRKYLYTGAIVMSPLFKNKDFKLDLIMFGYDIYYTYEVTSIQQLKAICETYHYDHTGRKSWKKTAESVSKNLFNKDILVISDGTESAVYPEYWLNNRVSSISTFYSNALNNLCKRTNGKYFHSK